MNQKIKPINFEANDELINNIRNILANVENYNHEIENLDVSLKILEESPTKEKEILVEVSFTDSESISIAKKEGSFIVAAQKLADSLRDKFVNVREGEEDRTKNKTSNQTKLL